MPKCGNFPFFSIVYLDIGYDISNYIDANPESYVLFDASNVKVDGYFELLENNNPSRYSVISFVELIENKIISKENVCIVIDARLPEVDFSGFISLLDIVGRINSGPVGLINVTELIVVIPNES